MSPSHTVIAISLTQAVIALALALLFHGFHHVYRGAQLRFWAYSFWAGAVYFLFSALSLHAAVVGGGLLPRMVSSLISLSAAYPQVIYLLAGTYVAATRRRVSLRMLRILITAGMALGAASALAYAATPDAADARMFLRLELRQLLTAGAFVTAGLILWQVHSEKPGFGQRLLAAAFVIHGIQLFNTFTVFVSQRLLDTTFAFTPYLGLADLVTHVSIGFSLVIWLLEEERYRAKAATRKLYHLSFHDPLTGLPNRKLFMERLKHALGRDSSSKRIVALVNVDRFRLLNESMGHQKADKLLALISDRLLHASGQADTVARFGVDEFALLLSGDGDDSAMNALQAIAGKLQEPYDIDGRDVLLTCSIGVSRSPEDSMQAETLMASATAAVLRGKELGGNQLIAYSPDMGGRAQEQLDFENDLRRALERDEFRLVYQPVLSANNDKLLGFEALLRWKHVRLGLLNPDAFLGLAESLGLMDRITDWVMGNACRQIREWRQRFDLPLWVAVNLSASAFRQADLCERILSQLKESQLDTEDLTLEITENIAMENVETGMVTLEQMRMRGIRIAIDDFGTGFSSLSYLRRLPVDKIKLDKEFIHELSRDIGSMAIVEALVPLAHKLGMRVVAEGVETREQLRLLREAGCDEIQGFLMYEPMPSATCESILEAISAAPYFKDEVI